MGLHVSAIMVGLAAGLVLHTARLVITSMARARPTPPPAPLAPVPDVPPQPDPTRDEHVAFPDDNNVIDLAMVRARRG